MTLTTTERITVDGVDLKTLAWNITTLAATLRRGGRRGSNAPVAGRHGTLWTPGKLRDEVVYNWPMWVRGTDQDGLIPGGSSSRREFFRRVDELIALFSKTDALLDVRHTLPDASVRQAFLEVTDIIDFTTKGVNPLGRINVQLTNPMGVGQDVTAINQQIVVGTGVPATINFTSFVGTTEIIDDLTLSILGPLTNAKVEAYRDGSALSTPIWVQYNGVISAGQELVLNAATGAFSGTGGLSPNLSNIVWSGVPRFFALVPRINPNDPPQVRVTGTSPGVATRVSILGRRKYGTW